MTWFFAVISLAIFFGIIRNLSVYLVGVAFLYDKHLSYTDYDALPSYESMLFHPRHQFRWTKAQWVKWVEAQA